MDDKNTGVQRRKGFTCIKEFDGESEAIVGILNHRDIILVATTKRVYKVIDGHLEPMKFVVPEGEGKE